MAQSVYQLSDAPAALIFKELRRNTFPILASTLLGLVLNFMELYYVSYLGKTALSGVVVAVTWTTTIFALTLGSYSTGVTREIAVHQDAVQRLPALAVTVLLGGIGLGVLSMLFFMPFGEELLSWMGLTGEALREGSIFLRVNAIAFPFLFFLGGFQGFMRGVGDPTTANQIITATIILNLIFTPLLALPWGLYLGVAGAAWGSVLAYACGMIWSLHTLSRQRVKWAVILRNVRNFDLQFFLKVLYIAIPSALTMFTIAITITILQNLVSRYGQEFLTAFSIVLRLELMIAKIGGAYGAAVLYVTSTYYTEAKLASALKSIRIQQAFLIGSILPIILWLSIMPTSWGALFTTNPEILGISTINTKYFVFGLPFIGLAQVIGFSFIAFGKPLWSLSLVVVKSFVFVIPVMAFLILIIKSQNMHLLFFGQVITIPCVWIYGEILLKRLHRTMVGPQRVALASVLERRRSYGKIFLFQK